MSFGGDIGRSTGRTPLDEWDMRFVPGARYVSDDEIRRALAIAQAVDELDRIGTDEAPDWIKRRADELLEGK